MTFNDILSVLYDSFLALVACSAFACILNCPKDKVIFTGITGGAGWLSYSVLLLLGVHSVPAVFISTAIITAISRILSYAKKAPVTIFLIIGIFPLVPGAGIFETGYNIFMNNTNKATELALLAGEIAVVMAFAIGIVLSLPQVLFSFTKKNLRSKIEKDNYN